MGHSVRLDLINNGQQIQLANYYTIWDAQQEDIYHVQYDTINIYS